MATWPKNSLKNTVGKVLKTSRGLVNQRTILPIIGSCIIVITLSLTAYRADASNHKVNPTTQSPQKIAVTKPTPVKTAPKTVATPAPAPAPITQPKRAVATTTSNPPGTSTEPATAPSPGTGVSNLAPAPPPSGGGGSNTGGGGGSGGSSSYSPSGSYESENWSGYLTTAGRFSAVSAHWTATTPTGNGTSVSADASWIGIGGVSSGDLIQVGTQNTVQPNGQIQSGAFYELLPSAAESITTMTVSPGDSMSASIIETSTSNWTITITDNSDNETFTTAASYTSTNSSAEWIEEDPSYINGQLVPFDNFGTANFSNASTTLNGTPQNLAGSQSDPVTMVNGLGQDIAVPSNVNSEDTGFSVAWH